MPQSARTSGVEAATSTRDARRHVPRTDAILADPGLAPQLERLDRSIVKAEVQRVLAEVRAGKLEPGQAAQAAAARLSHSGLTMRPVINATGVVLHTNLGRAPLGAAAVSALQTAAGYVDVEFDVGNGKRARRGRGALDALLTRTPAAEDALIVNNGAAALVLAATSLAAGREILVSRGELVEIGDGFRIPELLQSTGARLREVGTTNRTHLADYRDAIGPDTAFILKIHPSNFSVSGFTSEVGVAELATLGLPVIADIGSGLLSPHPVVPDEPDASTWLSQGADLVTASGDKLLGGPQAGIILGRKDLVHRLRRHPLQRALRADKLALAALEATVSAITTPVEEALTADPVILKNRCAAVVALLQEAVVPAEVVPSAGLVGGGGAPELRLAGWAVELPGHYAPALRTSDPCVVARVEGGKCLLDLRCVPSASDQQLVRAVLAVRDSPGQNPPAVPNKIPME